MTDHLPVVPRHDRLQPPKQTRRALPWWAVTKKKETPPKWVFSQPTQQLSANKYKLNGPTSG